MCMCGQGVCGGPKEGLKGSVCMCVGLSVFVCIDMYLCMHTHVFRYVSK
jgi:hypothetical protein